MPHETGLISTIAVALGFALVGGFVATRLRLPALLGYLLAGIAVGPFTPGFIADAHLAPQLAEIGVILLMFGVGIHFSLQDLLAVRAIAVPGAVGQIAVATALAVGLAVWWGWSPGSGLVLGLAVSVASTVVLLRALLDRGQLETAAGRAAVGWLIVEDIFTVLALVLLPAFAPQLGAGTSAGAAALSGGHLLAELAVTLGKIALLGVLTFVVGTRTVPWFLLQVARTGSQELFTLAVLAIALGVAYGSAVVFGVSFALGAFLAGLVVGESDLSHQAAADALPLRDAFAVLFFVSVGMLFDPSFLLDNPGWVLAVVALVVVGKPLAALVIVLALRHPLRTGLVVAAGLAQIGEFSFILADLGRNLRLLPDDGYNLVLAAALISITLNPLAFRTIEPIERWIERRPRLAALLTRRPPPDATAAQRDEATPARTRDHAVLCGYGRVGQVVAAALEQHAIPCLVVDQDRGRLEPLRRRGRAVLEGDAADRSTLEQMNLPAARLLIVAIPDPLETRHIVEQASRANPRLPIIARTHSEEEYAYLSDGRVAEAVLGERELARTMSRSALRYLHTAADSTSLKAGGGAHVV